MPNTVISLKQENWEKWSTAVAIMHSDARSSGSDGVCVVNL